MKWMLDVFLMELRKLLTYRSDFWINFVGLTFFSLIIAYFLWDSIFSTTGTVEISGYTLQGMIFYYLMAPLIFRIQQGQNIGFISRDIYDGSFNKYILYPINLNQYKIATYFAHSIFFLVQIFLILGIYNIFFYDPSIYDFSFINLILFLCVILLNCLSYYYLFSICELTAFWFDNIWSLGVMLRFICSFLGGALIPLALFPEWGQEILSYTPFPYMVDFPYQVLVGNITYSQIAIKLLLTFGWLLVFRFISKIVWKKGRYAYTGIGI